MLFRSAFFLPGPLPESSSPLPAEVALPDRPLLSLHSCTYARHSVHDVEADAEACAVWHPAEACLSPSRRGTGIQIGIKSAMA